MRAPLYIYVDPYLFEFYATLHDSPEGIIEVKKQDKFYYDLAYILQLKPKEYKNNIVPPKKRLIFLLPRFRTLDKRIETIYRNHLDSQREQMVVKKLVCLFKNTMHNFILGSVMTGYHQNVKQADAIKAFLLAYKIPEKYINYETLKKSWDRSAEKQKFLEIRKKPQKTIAHHVLF